MFLCNRKSSISFGVSLPSPLLHMQMPQTHRRHALRFAAPENKPARGRDEGPGEAATPDGPGVGDSTWAWRAGRTEAKVEAFCLPRDLADGRGDFSRGVRGVLGAVKAETLRRLVIIITELVTSYLVVFGITGFIGLRDGSGRATEPRVLSQVSGTLAGLSRYREVLPLTRDLNPHSRSSNNLRLLGGRLKGSLGERRSRDRRGLIVSSVAWSRKLLVSAVASWMFNFFVRNYVLFVKGS